MDGMKDDGMRTNDELNWEPPPIYNISNLLYSRRTVFSSDDCFSFFFTSIFFISLRLNSDISSDI